MEKDIQEWNTALTNAMSIVFYGFWCRAESGWALTWGTARFSSCLLYLVSVCSLYTEVPCCTKGGTAMKRVLLGLLRRFKKIKHLAWLIALREPRHAPPQPPKNPVFYPHWPYDLGWTLYLSQSVSPFIQRRQLFAHSFGDTAWRLNERVSVESLV